MGDCFKRGGKMFLRSSNNKKRREKRKQKNGKRKNKSKAQALVYILTTDDAKARKATHEEPRNSLGIIYIYNI